MSQITLDLVLPLTYEALFAAFIVHVYDTPASVAAVFTAAKTVLFVLALLLIVSGALFVLIRH